MRRSLSKDQEKLYQQYAILEEKLKGDSSFIKDKFCYHQSIWKLITMEGLWKLPVSKEYGGRGSGWEECSIAIEGLTSWYNNVSFFPFLVSQLSSIYLISKFGTKNQKEEFLPRLIQGEISLVIVNELSNQEIYISNIKHSDIVIFSTSNMSEKDKFLFFLIDRNYEVKKNPHKNLCQKPSVMAVLKDVRLKNNEPFFSKEKGKEILVSLIDFERLLYGFLGAGYIRNQVIKIKEKTTLSSSNNKYIACHRKLNEIENKTDVIHKEIYHKFIAT